jgi:hypothetical protein
VVHEPVREAQIVGKAAQQRHAEMRVHVDQTRHQGRLGHVDKLLGRILGERLVFGQHGDDATAAHDQRVIEQHALGRGGGVVAHRHNVARGEDRVGLLLGCVGCDEGGRSAIERWGERKCRGNLFDFSKQMWRAATTRCAVKNETMQFSKYAIIE